MDREIAPEVRRRKVTKRVLAVVVATAAVVFSVAATVSWLRPSVARNDLQFARVERGAVEATLQASGTLVPAVEQVVSSPIDARVLRIVRRAGDRVRSGDPIVELDTSTAKLDVAKQQDQLVQKENEATQLRLKLEDDVAAKRAEIERKNLDLKIDQYKSSQNAKLHEAGLVAKQDALAAETTEKKSEIELAQLREGLVRSEHSAQVQIAAEEMAIAMLRKELEESRRQLELAMMRADRDGVLTSVVEDAGATVHKGDVIARIADLSSYRVMATISDVHAAHIARGMRVRVKVNDDTSLDGTISSIEPRIDNGQAKFYAQLDDRSNAALRNNARVDVFVVTGSQGNSLRVKRGALGTAEREDVFVVHGDRLLRVPVHWGLAGDQTIQIAEGLAAGDEVVIADMKDYEGVRELRLK